MTAQKKIMVVEDNDFVRMQIVKFLTDEGFETVESTDGQGALDSMNEDIAIAIVDVRMEPVNGLEFIRAIRAEGNNTPVVLVTGDNDPELLHETQKLDVAALLKKPVEKDRLTKIVQRIQQMKERG